MPFGNSPILEGQHEGQRTTGGGGVGGAIVGTSGEVRTALSATIELPREAIVTLAEGVRVISQRWLATQPPPAAFLAAGGEVFDDNNPHSGQENHQNKMQCWHKNGIWYWNESGGDWLGKYYGGHIPKFRPLASILRTNMQQGKDATMARMGVVKSGYFYSGEIYENESGYIRSSSFGGEYSSRAEGLRFNDDTFQLEMYCYLVDDKGTVPFIVLNA